MSGPEYVYRTTDAVKCEWCGAEPGQPCHDDRGTVDLFASDDTKRFHTIRIDPTSEPVGVMGPKRPGYAFREILPIPPTPPTEGAE